MKSLRYIFMLFIAFMIVGCTPPERIKDNQSTDNTENNGGGDNDNNGGGAENPSKPQTSAPYQVGDYYNESGKEGIVFSVDDSGANGKIISLLQSTETLQWTSDVVEQNRAYGATNSSEGLENFAKIAKVGGWQSKYPAFKWCYDLGRGWYLPAIQELERFTIYPTIRDAVNKGLTDNGGTPIGKLSYWSSTEDNSQNSEGLYKANYVNVNSAKTLSNLKKYKFYIRAVATFGDHYDDIHKDIIEDIYDNDTPEGDNPGGGDTPGGDNPGEGDPNDPTDPSNPTDPDNPNNPTDPSNPTDPDNPSNPTDPDNPDNPNNPVNPDGTTSPPYKVGDYYNENGLTGTVFYVTDNGYSGKIINKSVGECAWATGSTLTELVGTNSQTNGRRNMDIITAIKDWQSRYPAFKWCADLGEDWYLPALNELYEIVKHRDILGLGQYYGWAFFWSSTEVNKIEYGDFGCILETDAYIVPVAPEPPLMYSDKSSVLYVFAVASFGRDVDIGKNDDTIGDDNNGGIGGGVTTYYIGKLVEVDGVKGIVFQTSPCVKIFSVQQTMTQWSVESEVGESTGEMDKYDGAKNMAVLKARGLDKYPAAKWCADLGDGWYLPAVYEYEDIFYKAAAFDEVLSDNGFEIFGWNDYWTSTSDPLYSFIVDFPYGGMGYDFKHQTYSVRAMRVID